MKEIPKQKIIEYGDFSIAISDARNSQYFCKRMVLHNIQIYLFKNYYYAICEVFFFKDVSCGKDIFGNDCESERGKESTNKTIRLSLPELFELFDVDAMSLMYPTFTAISSYSPVDRFYEQMYSTQPDWFQSDYSKLNFQKK